MIKIKIYRSRRIREEKTGGLNNIQQHNLNFLLQNSYPGSTSRGQGDTITGNFAEDIMNQRFEKTGDFDLYDKEENIPNEQTIAKELVQVIPSLKSNKITKAITGASFGKIFELDNNHILKLFLGGVNPKEDIKWYKKNQKMMFSGHHKKNTSLIPIYGEPNWGNLLPSFPDVEVGHVEMAKFIPLDDYFKSSGLGEGDTIIAHSLALFKSLYDKNKNLKWIKSEIQNFLAGANPDAIEPFNQKQFMSLIEAFHTMLSMGFDLTDIADRNMAVLEQDKNNIVIFDR